MKKSIIILFMFLMLLSIYPLYAKINKPTFEDKIKLMDLYELEDEIEIARSRINGSTLSAGLGISGICAGGFIIKFGNDVFFQENTDPEISEIEIISAVGMAAAGIVVVGSGIIITTLGVVVTGRSIKDIIIQSNRIENIKFEIVKFKSLSSNQKPVIGIGLAIPL